MTSTRHWVWRSPTRRVALWSAIVTLCVWGIDGALNPLIGHATCISYTPSFSSFNPFSPTSGSASGGTAVTVNGTNLNHGSVWEFGTTAAASAINGSSVEYLVTPAEAAGAVPIRIGYVNTSCSITYVTSSINFTFTGGSPPTVTGVSPASGPSGGGTPIVITGTGFTGATAVTFGATAAASYTVNSATQISAVSPSESPGLVNITVTTSGGTSTTSPSDQYTFSAQIGASMAVSAGTLAFVSTPASFSFTSVTLNGTNQGTTASVPLDIGDATGSGNGWNVTLSATTFTNTAGDTLADSAFQVLSGSPPTVACDTSSTCNLATLGSLYPYTLSGTGTKLLSSAANTGMGDQTVTIPWTATIPANAYAGTYASTWTFTLVSGP